jgi:hypothetical protein
VALSVLLWACCEIWDWSTDETQAKCPILHRQRSAVRGYWSRPSQLEGPLAGILGVMTKRNKINIQATSAGFCVFLN